MLAEIGGYYALMGILLAILGTIVAQNELIKSVLDGDPVELTEEINDHNLCTTIKEKEEFQVEQGEMDRIDKIV